MSPAGCPKMSATPCNRNADESFPVLRLKSREQKSPTPLLIQDKDVLQPRSKPFRTTRKSASAERCLRPLGATIDMAPPDMWTSNRFREGGIVAWMFTKRQLEGRGGYWVLSPSGNCWYAITGGPRRRKSHSSGEASRPCSRRTRLLASSKV